MNPQEQLKKIAKNIKPQDMVMEMIKKNTNPMMKNLIEMAQRGDSKGVEQFARNFYKEIGQDFDKEFSDFMKNFK